MLHFKIIVDYVVDAYIGGIGLPNVSIGNCIIKFCTIAYHILGSSLVYLEQWERSQNRRIDTGIGLYVLSTGISAVFLSKVPFCTEGLTLTLTVIVPVTPLARSPKLQILFDPVGRGEEYAKVTFLS